MSTAPLGLFGKVDSGHRVRTLTSRGLRMKFDVYNLEFRSWIDEMTVGTYRFSRVNDYKTKVQGLPHRISCYSEFDIKATTGNHSVTAIVETPDPEPSGFIWAHPGASALDDITLILSIFTGRHVFVVRDKLADNQGIILSPPIRLWRRIATSIPYVAKSTQDRGVGPDYADAGLEIGLNEIWTLVNTADWRSHYRNGFYLILFKNAIQQPVGRICFYPMLDHLGAPVHNLE